MKNFHRQSIALFLAAAIVLGGFATVSAPTANASSYTFTGQTSSTTQNLTVDGIDTGADWTQIKIAQGSGIAESVEVGGLINIVEADLSNTKLSFDVVINNTDGYLSSVTSTTVKTAMNNYSNGDAKAIAAVNGDWMMLTNTDLNLGLTKNYWVPVSTTIVDSEIWCSQITNLEPVNGVPYDGPYSFGITSDNQPLIGQLQVDVSVKNTTSGATVYANGLNRSPANNTIVVYNNRFRQNACVPSDAYEILIKTNETNKFKHNVAVTGTVEAVYPAGSATRHDLTDGYIIVMARGTRLSEIENNFSVGNNISVTASLTDAWNRNDDLWAKCTEALGGHHLIMKDGRVFNQGYDTNTTNYPSNIIGYKDDGTVVMSVVTADQAGTRAPFQMSELNSFCQSVGYNTCFLYDGGGSATMVTLEDSSFTTRSCGSDGTDRAVWNSLALIYDPTPDCSVQGSLDHIIKAEKFDPYDVSFTQGMLYSFTDPIDTVVTASDGVLTLKATADTDDPFVTWNFGADYAASTLDATAYKYAVVRYKTNASGSADTFGMYLCAGDVTAAVETIVYRFAMQNDGQWHTQVIDLSSISEWSGNVNNIRLDYIDGNCNEGDTVELSNFGFAKNNKEANTLKNSFEENASAATPTPTPDATQTPETTPTPTPAPTASPAISDSTIVNIPAGTTVKNLMTSLKAGNKYKVYKGTTEVKNTSNACTGMTVNIMEGKNVKATYTLIVVGDADGDGTVSVADATAVLQHIRGQITLEGVYLAAAQVEASDPELNVLDAAVLINMI